MQTSALQRLRGFAAVVFAAGLMMAARAQPVAESAEPVGVTPPRAVKTPKLEYPEMFAVEGLAFRGSTVVQFVVGKDGSVQSPRVAQVSHPAFVPPALEALFKTQFAPATAGGEPVASRFTWVYNFDWEGISGRGIGVEPFTLPPVSSPGVPAEFRYDVAPRPTFTCEPVYPRELLFNRVTGSAKVNLVIDKAGRVAGAKVAAMSHPEFGAALVASVEAWRFTPALRDGRATVTVITREHTFARGNRDLASDADATRLIGAYRAANGAIAEAAALEAAPRLLYEVTPEYPRSLATQRLAGEATVEFLVDRRGRVRLPHVVASTHTGFGWAAATAVQQRFYEVPRLKGRTVDVRMVQVFSFAPPEKAGGEPIITVR